MRPLLILALGATALDGDQDSIELTVRGEPCVSL
jgi:hypothetical protein